jgi:glycine oxidase
VKVAIIGAGVMGCTTALSLAERGADVTLLERAVPGAEASSAAAGILGAQIELQGRRSEVASLVRARESWHVWARELSESTGIDIGYRITGVLRVARSEVERETISTEVDWQRAQGLRAVLLDSTAAHKVEPELAPDIVGAAHFPDDGQVDPPALLRALTIALARAARTTVRTGATARRLMVDHDRCVGVQLDDGELLADAIVLAAGSWSSLIAGIPSSLPVVRPVRGQIVLLDERPPRARSIVFGASGYVVPRGDGRVVCGSTTEHAGFRKEVTAAGIHQILHDALTCLPSLASAQVAGMWSNFRPYVEVERALVGKSVLPGLFLATGHYRNGILLSKTSADAVAGAILEGT